jgi:hypothetical protein
MRGRKSTGDMPLINYVKMYGADVAKVLKPDERLVDMGPYREPLIGDESRLERTFDELSPRMREHVEKRGSLPASDKFVQGFDPLAGGLQVNPSRIDRWLGGISGEGGVSSIAGQLWRAADKYDGDTSYAVTDQRLLLLGEAKLGSGDYRIIFELPRTAVASAARKGKLLFQRGRVEVRFTDRSMKAWTPGMVFAARARSLVAALTGPMTQTGAA